MKNKSKRRGSYAGALIAALACAGVLACDSGGSEPSTNGELHWAKGQALMACGQDSECADPALRCLCGVCSVGCAPGGMRDACQGAPAGVSCMPSADAPRRCGGLDAAILGVCLMACAEDAECGAQMSCSRGVCVSPDELADPACRQDLDGDGLRDCDEPYYRFDPRRDDTYGDGLRDRDRAVVARCPPPSERECVRCEIFGPEGPMLDVVVLVDLSASMAQEHGELPEKVRRLFETLRLRGAKVRLGVAPLHGDEAGPYTLQGGWFDTALGAQMGTRALILGSTGNAAGEGLDTVKGLLDSLRLPGPDMARPEATTLVLVATDDEAAAVKTAGMPCNDTVCPAPVETSHILPIASQGARVIAWTSFPGGLCTGERSTAYSRLGAATGGAAIDLCDPNQDLVADTIWSLVSPTLSLTRIDSTGFKVLVDGREVPAGAEGWQVDAATNVLRLGPSQWPITQQAAVVHETCVAP